MARGPAARTWPAACCASASPWGILWQTAAPGRGHTAGCSLHQVGRHGERAGLNEEHAGLRRLYTWPRRARGEAANAAAQPRAQLHSECTHAVLRCAVLAVLSSPVTATSCPNRQLVDGRRCWQLGPAGREGSGSGVGCALRTYVAGAIPAGALAPCANFRFTGSRPPALTLISSRLVEPACRAAPAEAAGLHAAPTGCMPLHAPASKDTWAQRSAWGTAAASYAESRGRRAVCGLTTVAKAIHQHTLCTLPMTRMMRPSALWTAQGTRGGGLEERPRRRADTYTGGRMHHRTKFVGPRPQPQSPRVRPLPASGYVITPRPPSPAH